MDSYIVIHSAGSDGVFISQHTQEDLEKKLDERYWGNTTEIVPELPSETSIEYWRGHLLVVIKGKVIVPKAVETVTKFKLE